MSLDKALSVIEPPKALKEWMMWDTASKREKAIVRTCMAAVELVTLNGLAMVTIPAYMDKVVDAMFVADDIKSEFLADIHKYTDNHPESRILQDELQEGVKTEKIYDVSNSQELFDAISDINNRDDESKETMKYEIKICGEIQISEQINTQAHGKQDTEVEKYFDTNVGIILPEGVTLKITGEDPEKDKLVFSNQKIGIYGQNLGQTTISNLTIERTGTSDQTVDSNELVRSFIYLSTENESIVTSRASINNVNIINSIPQVKDEEHFSMMTSGMTFVGFSSVEVQSSHIEDFYWDGIAAFGGRSLAVTDSTIKRNVENYFYNVGAAVAIIPGYYNATLTVNNTSADNYMKYFAVYGPYSNQSSVSLTDVTTQNDIESAHYLIVNTEDIYMERVRTNGLGLSMLLEGGMRFVDNMDIIDSSFIIRRNTAPDNFYEPNNIKDIIESPNTRIHNSTFDIDEASEDEKSLFDDHQIKYVSR